MIHDDSNEDFYGEPYRTRSIVLGRAKPGSHLDEIETWRATLRQYARYRRVRR